ncbi:MAG: hypothetical protein LBL83_13860 [Clostridiales bacterium]|jgi:hypothetical protein|nr:hypothetical protein [Clostridiales bacterium]
MDSGSTKRSGRAGCVGRAGRAGRVGSVGLVGRAGRGGWRGRLAAALAAVLAVAAALLPGAAPAGALSAFAGSGAAAASSGMKLMGYAVYEANSQRAMQEIFKGDSFRIVVRFSKSPDVTIVGAMSAPITSTSFSGAISAMEFSSDGTMLTLEYALKYSGGSRSLSLNLMGSLKLPGAADAAQFDDPVSILVTECYADDLSGPSYIPPSGQADPPRLAVDTSAKFATARAGERYEFELPVKNVGKQGARDITVSIDPGENAGFPFEYDKYAFTARIGTLAINEVKLVSFRVNVLPTAKDGQNNVNVKFTARPSLAGDQTAESSEVIIIRISNSNTAPKLAIDSAEPSAASVMPGSAFSLAVRLRNSGTLEARDVKLSLKGLAPDGIVTADSTDIRYLSDIRGKGSVTEIFQLEASEKLSGEHAALTIGVSWKDEAGKEYGEDSALFVPLDAKPAASSYTAVEFANVSSPGGELREGSNFSVTFEVRNTGDVYMENVKLSYAAGQEFIGKTLNTMMLKPIAPGAAVPARFDFSVSKPQATGNYPIAFTIEYTPAKPGSAQAGAGGSAGAAGSAGATGAAGTSGAGTAASSGAGGAAGASASAGADAAGAAGSAGSAGSAGATGATSAAGSAGGSPGAAPDAKPVTATQYVGVQLFKPDEKKDETTTVKASVPKIIISRYSYEPEDAKAGQTVDITLTFFNTSMSETVKNIKAQLNSASSESSSSTASQGGIFTPVEGSNTFYIEQIEPRHEVDKSITLYIKGDAEPKSYPLYSDIEYEDSKNNPITARESISIPVSQQTKLMIGDINMAGAEASVGAGFGVSFEFINMGKTTLYNVMVSTAGPFSAQAQSYYAGNMLSGATDFYDGSVVPESAGEQMGAVVVTYEDAAGKTYEERKEFPISVMDSSDMDFGGMGGDAALDSGGMGDGGGEPAPGLLGLAQRFAKPLPIAIAAGALLLIAGCVALAARRRKKRRRMEAALELDAGGDGNGNGKGGGPSGNGKGGGPSGGGSEPGGGGEELK